MFRSAIRLAFLSSLFISSAASLVSATETFCNFGNGPECAEVWWGGGSTGGEYGQCPGPVGNAGNIGNPKTVTVQNPSGGSICMYVCMNGMKMLLNGCGDGWNNGGRIPAYSSRTYSIPDQAYITAQHPTDPSMVYMWYKGAQAIVAIQVAAVTQTLVPNFGNWDPSRNGGQVDKWICGNGVDDGTNCAHTLWGAGEYGACTYGSSTYGTGWNGSPNGNGGQFLTVYNPTNTAPGSGTACLYWCINPFDGSVPYKSLITQNNYPCYGQIPNGGTITPYLGSGYYLAIQGTAANAFQRFSDGQGNAFQFANTVSTGTHAQLKVASSSATSRRLLTLHGFFGTSVA